MNPIDYTEAVAAEVRAELGRQRRRAGDLADALGMSPATVARRLDGTTPFDVFELAQAAHWLGVPVDRFTPAPAAVTAGTSSA